MQRWRCVNASAGLLRVYGPVRRLLVQEERARILRADRLELTRRLIEVKHVAAVAAVFRPEAVGRRVGRTQPSETEGVLDEADDAAERVDLVGDIAGLTRLIQGCVWR